MVGSDHVAIFPSRANFVIMKQRIGSADRGLSLLKRKRDALEVNSKQISAELKKKYEKLAPAMQEAILSMAKANFLRTDLKPASIVNPNRADAYLSIKYIKVVGLQVPTLDLVMKPTNALNFTGLGCGGQQVQIVREKFQEALKCLVAVASLEYSVVIMTEAIKSTNMRVNGLEYVVLPRYQNTLTYIRDELEELEREDLYRLKRSQAKQRQRKADFINLIRNRDIESVTNQQSVDFTDTHLTTPIAAVLSSKGTESMMERRKTVTKVGGKKIILGEEKPIRFADKSGHRLSERKSDDIKPAKVVTSSSSESD